MSDLAEEVSRRLQNAREKYVYFLLAAAASAVALSVQRTVGMSLSWWMTPLAVAVLCWGVSFYCGCRHIEYANSILFSNFDLILVERGTHAAIPKPTHRGHIEAASRGILDAIASKEKTSAFHARMQKRTLILGAAFFIAWHVGEMTRAALYPPPAPAVESKERLDA